ncbi:uncharacterized protein PGRI_020170 [Penicillium griseofulvum]|uniref:Uncharacterized protein n=1 Tax=Penicillium patulum TaxID=5078 RepID=A0A135LGN7_PENPA|nr:uncharacterized protein PGRI_020170 [Penicillium griseofulvum]KXG48147.1 hypothetical protein PGRI_020170 [Penicillium griseofulvum]
MSELFFEDQESKTVPYYHDRPPQYDSCQSSQDVLTTVIENERTCRILIQRLNSLGTEMADVAENSDKPTDSDHLLRAELLLEMSRLFAEGSHISRELADIYKERPGPNSELYVAMSRLTFSEFDRTYASLRRNANRQIQDELGQDHTDRTDCSESEFEYNSQCTSEMNEREGTGDLTHDPPCSCDRFLELSAKVDEIHDKLGQSLQSHETANVSETIHDTPAKRPRSFWRRIMKHPL